MKLADIKVEVPATKPYSGDINKLEAAKDAPQMIVIISNPEDPARGNLSWYRRDPSGRLVSVMNEVCVTGMNGVVSPEEKQEGDMKTPSGLYHFSGAYGLGRKLSAAQPGDIIIIGTNGSANRIFHVGIYYNNGLYIHANGELVTISKVPASMVVSIIRLPGLDI